MKVIINVLLVFCSFAFFSCQNEEEKNVLFNSSIIKPDSTFLDERDSTIYGTVRIGDQIWMTENLRYPLVGYSLDGAYTWGEKAKDKKNYKEVVKLADSIQIRIILDIVNDPQYNNWVVELEGFPGPYPLGNEIISIIEKRVKKGKMTIKQLLDHIEFFSKDFIKLHKEKEEETILLLLDSPEVRNQIGKESFLSAEKKNNYFSKKYGLLYTYDAALQAVPKGWRLPTDEDWITLEKNLGLSSKEAFLLNSWRGKGLATILSEDGLSGMKCLLAGGKTYTNLNEELYENKGEKWYYWTSTTYNRNDSTEDVIIRMAWRAKSEVWRGTSPKKGNYKPVLYSVRCVKDVIKSEE